MLLGATLWLSLVIGIATVMLSMVVRDYHEKQLAEEVSLYLDELSAFVSLSPLGKLQMQAQLANPNFANPYSGWYWQINTSDDVLRSRSMWDGEFDLRKEESPKGQDLLQFSRKLLLGKQGNAIELTVAVDYAHTALTVKAITRVLTAALMGIALSVLLLTWLQIHWSLKPMRLLKTELKAVHDGELAQLQNRYPEEVQPVINDLNRLLFHYAELLERSRHHTGNMAHALKTLAILRNQVDQLPSAQQVTFLEAIEQLQNRMDYHLARARMAGVSHILAVRSSPADTVDELSIVFEKAHADRDIVVVNELDDTVWLAVDQRDLEEMLGNVLDNAFKWANMLVRVTAKQDTSYMLISIIDDGTGIDEALQASVLQRGVRADEQVAGTGLGLNIVQEIAHSYRGSLTMENCLTGGLCVTLRLPISQSK